MLALKNRIIILKLFSNKVFNSLVINEIYDIYINDSIYIKRLYS